MRIQIERLSVRRRKLGVFTIGPVRELELTGLRVDLQPCRAPECVEQKRRGTGPEAEVGLEQALQEPLRTLPVGLVTRMSVDGFEVEWREAAGGLRLAADEARIDGVGGPIELRSLVVEAARGERLRAQAGDWRPARRELAVRRGYQWVRDSGRVEVGTTRIVRLDPGAGLDDLAPETAHR
jgi:hypothetical protein